jgi:hypothetical protein
VRWPQPGRRVGDVLLGGEPLEEVLQRPELVAGIGAAVVVQEAGGPLLDVLPGYLLPAGMAGAGEEVGGGEPGHRLGVGGDGLGGVALGGQVEPERADLRLEALGVHRPRPPGTGL